MADYRAATSSALRHSLVVGDSVLVGGFPLCQRHAASLTRHEKPAARFGRPVYFQANRV
jgi:hypothetical protein